MYPIDLILLLNMHSCSVLYVNLTVR